MTNAGRVRAVFGRDQASITVIRDSLWTSIDASAYEGPGEKYQASLLEQYKIYAEMADRVSARRSVSNAFFLTVNTGVVTAVSVFSKSLDKGGLILLLPLIILLLQCGAWFWVLKSYRQLSSAKYRVIGVMEERLPASPYWLAEWKALGSGKDKALYWPITQLEQWSPAVFASAYVVMFVLVLGHA